MTGSSLAPVVIPIVAVVVLAVWLTMVYWADAHPPRRGGVSESGLSRSDATAPGEVEGRVQPPAPPQRRAA